MPSAFDRPVPLRRRAGRRRQQRQEEARGRRRRSRHPHSALALSDPPPCREMHSSLRILHCRSRIAYVWGTRRSTWIPVLGCERLTKVMVQIQQ
eukprot:557157-Pleurochrysis_carterae.AAC.1